METQKPHTRISLTKREAETKAGDELLDCLEKMADSETYTSNDFVELKQFLEELSKRANFPAISFLLNEVTGIEPGGRVPIQKRLQLFDSIQKVLPPDMRIEPEKWESDKPTEKQLERIDWCAKKLGEQIPEPKTKGEASLIISLWASDAPQFEELWHQEKNRRLSSEELMGSVECTKARHSSSRTSNVKGRGCLVVAFMLFVLVLVAGLMITCWFR